MGEVSVGWGVQGAVGWGGVVLGLGGVGWGGVGIFEFHQMAF